MENEILLYIIISLAAGSLLGVFILLIAGLIKCAKDDNYDFIKGDFKEGSPQKEHKDLQ